MSAILYPISIPTYIEYGKICSFLANDDENNFVANPGGTVTPDLSRLIYIVTESLKFQYAFDASDVSVITTALYLYELCGKYIQVANTIIGQGGGIVVIPGGDQLTLVSERIEFTVGQAGALMNSGDVSFSVAASRVLNNSAAVVRNDVPLPINNSTQISFIPTYGVSSLLITFNQAVIDDDLIVLTFLRFA